jgi:ornithine cyclodeaminase/alanine dehydrogenase-like protein (mu-crystallin family)
MSDNEGVLFIPYADTVDLLSAKEALQIVEDVYRMQGEGSVMASTPPSFKLDVGEPFHNHWHVKCALLKETEITGVRLYNYFDDGNRNTVGQLECGRYIILADPNTGTNRAIVEEHWTYAIRSAAATTLPLKWLGPKDPKVVGIVGVGTMATNALRCLVELYDGIEEIRCTSRNPKTREAFAEKWSAKLGINVVAKDSIEEAVRDADIGIGGTTSDEIMCREPWLKPGATYVSFTRREFDPEGWPLMDKVVVDSWEMNMLMKHLRATAEAGIFTRDMLHGEIHELVRGKVAGRESATERNLIHTTGLVAHDIAMCHYVYEKAVEKGVGVRLPFTGTGNPGPID